MSAVNQESPIHPIQDPSVAYARAIDDFNQWCNAEIKGVLTPRQYRFITNLFVTVLNTDAFRWEFEMLIDRHTLDHPRREDVRPRFSLEMADKIKRKGCEIFTTFAKSIGFGTTVEGW